MALKTYNPVTPGQRQLVTVDRSTLYKGPPVKSLTEGQSSTGGRNNHGRITSRFRGGGHKQAYRRIDFRRSKFDVPATVERLEYDPNRTAFIALIKYQDGELAYILAPQRLAPGDSVIASEHADVKPGNAMPIANIPVGTIVHNVEIKVGKGGQIARSAGSYVQIVGRDHFLGHQHRDVLLAVVDAEVKPNELRQDGRAAAPDLDHLMTTGRARGFRLAQQISVDERALPT